MGIERVQGSGIVCSIAQWMAETLRTLVSSASGVCLRIQRFVSELNVCGSCLYVCFHLVQKPAVHYRNTVCEADTIRLKTTVFWDAVPCSLIEIYRCFG
jgi:hypothetical protein